MVDPPEWLIKFAVPQIILAVASTSLQITREIAVKRGPGKRWTADLPAEFDDSYTQEVLRALAESTGRQIRVREPEGPEQARIVQSVIATARSETDWLSATSLLWGTRFRHRT